MWYHCVTWIHIFYLIASIFGCDWLFHGIKSYYVHICIHIHMYMFTYFICHCILFLKILFLIKRGNDYIDKRLVKFSYIGEVTRVPGPKSG